MDINPRQKKEIKKIISTSKCFKDFECYKSGFEKLCRAMDWGLGEHVECLEKAPLKCQFGTMVGESRLCSCPLRIYVVRELQK